MPITRCYEVADEDSKYCSTGFPIGCHVSEDGQARDACVTSVSFTDLLQQTFGYFLYEQVAQETVLSQSGKSQN